MLHTCLYPPSFVRRFRAQIEMALRNMENGKATGPDNLPVEVWSLGRTGVNFLKEVLNKIREYYHTLRELSTRWSFSMLYGMETIPMTSSHFKKREVTEMIMQMGMRPHTKRPCEKR